MLRIQWCTHESGGFAVDEVEGDATSDDVFCDVGESSVSVGTTEAHIISTSATMRPLAPFQRMTVVQRTEEKKCPPSLQIINFLGTIQGTEYNWQTSLRSICILWGCDHPDELGKNVKWQLIFNITCNMWPKNPGTPCLTECFWQRYSLRI